MHKLPGLLTFSSKRQSMDFGMPGSAAPSLTKNALALSAANTALHIFDWRLARGTKLQPEQVVRQG
ncbi:hypothetical protein [Comamonas aquatica]|uniref:Uncharacterized protein n=1 Tax=Comamonas aquatica TaxID=225991 RepID=A0AA42HS96_9BURK|nr:hypothetical protein [Comamonas aquatica]MDH0363313.1 hypothetical protein [Comamonas aquatica]